MNRPTKRDREAARRRAGGCCDYCRYPLDFYCDEHLEIDHVYPASQGGPDVLGNYAYACPGCNARKYNKTVSVDPVTEKTVCLFDPRRELWSEHFCWGGDKLNTIVGLTATRRATVSAFQLNRVPLKRLREILFDQGMHPTARAIDPDSAE